MLMSLTKKSKPLGCTLAVLSGFATYPVFSDTVTDWNYYTLIATKGATSATTGDKSIALNSNVATRIDAIAARAVFDAVNAIDRFSNKRYYYKGTPLPAGLTAKSASAAAAQAAHDVLIGALPSTSQWDATRLWLNNQLVSDLATLGVSADDPGIAAGQSAAQAALAARANDFSQIRTTYTPSTNLSINTSAVPNTIVPNATGNPGAGVWRPSNGGAGVIDPATGAPTGFDNAGIIQPAAGIDFNWKNVSLFSLTTLQKQLLSATVPPSLIIDGPEYNHELEFVKTHGQDSLHPGNRTDDQLLQALYYKSDAELFTNEAARIASKARNLSVDQNARIFALLDNALADARIAAWQSKYDLLFWRPVSALNTDSQGNVAGYGWKPLATTPSHPSSTSGHSTTVAAGTEILRSFFKSDRIILTKAPVTLSSLPWLVGTNNGTGKLLVPVNGKDGTAREVNTFTQLQLENGRSRIYLGVHFPNDDFQGQSLGLAVSDAIIKSQADPAAEGINMYRGDSSVASLWNLFNLFVKNAAFSGFYGLSGRSR